MKVQKTWWRRSGVVLGVVIAALALLTSCSADESTVASSVSDAGSDSTDTAAEFGDDADYAVSDSEMFEEAETEEAMAEEAMMDEFAESDDAVDESGGDRASALGSSGLTASQVPAADFGRDIIFTAEVSVAIPDVATASAAAVEQITRLGGLVFGQQTTSDPAPRSVLTFKVPPADFQAALAALGSIGEVRNQTVTSDDVTERVVDLSSRISTAEASVNRLRGFLEEASDLETIATLERQLLERETDLERLKGQLRTVQDRVDLATITLTIVQLRSAPAVRLSTSAYHGADGGLSCPGGPDGLRVERDQPMTLCFDITNTGDTTLTDFTLRDQALGIESIDQLTKVFGTVDWAAGTTTLEPGHSVTLAWEHRPAHDARTLTQLSAAAIDESGVELGGQRVGDTSQFRVRAVDPGGIPSFGEGLAASWELLKSFALVALLIVAVLLPFVWLIVVALLAARWFSTRQAKRRQAEIEAAEVARGTAKAPEPGESKVHASVTQSREESAE